MIKRLLLFLTGFGGALWCAAMPATERVQVLGEAEKAFRSGMVLLPKAPEQAKPQFEIALRRFQLLEQDGVVNGRLYYNLGNCHFRLDDPARAILYYKRASFYIPGDVDLENNLRVARTRCGISEAGMGIGPDLFNWQRWASWPARSLALVVLIVAVAALGIAVTLTGRQVFRRSAMTAGIIAAVVLVSLLWDVWRLQANQDGVILSEVVARKGDGDTYQPSLAVPLRAGTEFSLLERRGDWWRASLGGDRTGWIPASAAALVAEKP
jgi:tetratricopeptide (TPR) repeat protein